VALIALLIRFRGDRGVPQDMDDVWSSIKNEWPILITADTLLSLQAMIRLVIAASVVLRTDDRPTAAAPLTDEPAAFLCLATCARIAMLSRTPHYMLDGPFGGVLPVACEVAVIPLLAVIAKGTAKKTLFSSCMAMVVALWFANRNHLNLADDSYGDVLFILAHTLELATAFFYLVRTLSVVCDADCNSASAAQVGLVHVLMALQAALPAYYFVVAFEHTPELIEKGHPFEVLQYGNLAAFGAYLAALALHTAVTETSESETPAPAAVAVAQPMVAAF